MNLYIVPSYYINLNLLYFQFCTMHLLMAVVVDTLLRLYNEKPL